MDELARQTDEEILVCMVIAVVALYNFLMHEALRIGLRRNRLRGRSFTLEFHEKRTRLRSLVYSNDSSCYNVLRMYRNTFDRLCFMLDEIGGLKPTKHMLVDEQVAMCLNILAHHAKNKNCLGALDGTHVKVRVDPNEQTRFRNRKGDVTINVLGVCSQDAQFIYVLSGWEGSAADSRVLKSALSRPRDFKVPAKQYYLVDTGYSNAQGFLAPFRGQRYHLNEWRECRHPTNPRECFNMRHSAARNVIERCFEMLKSRRSSKHNWSANEDAALVAIFVSMKDDQNDMQGSKFCSGHLSVIEKKMQEKLPGCRLKGIPHIQSRLQTLGKNWSTVHDMVYGTNTNGFGWDDDRQLVVAERDVWEAYIKVWGKDRATGAEARDADEDLDGLDGVGNSGQNQTPPGQHLLDDMTQPPPTDCEAVSTSHKRKRTSPSNDVIEGFKEFKRILEIGALKPSEGLLFPALDEGQHTQPFFYDLKHNADAF
ncbi:hypothetical protein G2W53_039355 [Senna tora]|uniref:Transposase n=1 Tax=Senna tora TaxID=362788 RepID=A0A834T172_9FABA|nr:hypothetical protein G2W53_039355 [Senna tora]